METKVCPKCGIELPLSDFNNNRSQKDGKAVQCRYCCKEYNKEYYEKNKEKRKEYLAKNKEKIKEQKKEYFAKNKEKIKEKRKEYNKEYSIKNKEKIKEYQKEYRKENKEKLKEYGKKYNENNKEKIKDYKKDYREKNKEKLKEYNKEYYEKNKEKVKEKVKECREKNKERRNEYLKEYNKNKRKEDELFAVSERCRSRIQQFIRQRGYKKTSKTFEMIGCTPEQLLEHLHKTWYDNYGTEYNGEPVHIDHIIPLSSAETEEDIYKLCHYSNLQYLKPEDNLAKSDSILQTI